jgi:hypothetical protein
MRDTLGESMASRSCSRANGDPAPLAAATNGRPLGNGDIPVVVAAAAAVGGEASGSGRGFLVGEAAAGAPHAVPFVAAVGGDRGEDDSTGSGGSGVSVGNDDDTAIGGGASRGAAGRAGDVGGPVMRDAGGVAVAADVTDAEASADERSAGLPGAETALLCCAAATADDAAGGVAALIATGQSGGGRSACARLPSRDANA